MVWRRSAFYNFLCLMHLTAKLRRLLDQAYETFAHYPQPLTLEASPLRDPDKLLTQLTAKPLRLLDVEDVQGYTSAALTTVGTVADFKHFLPRLLDLAVRSAVIEPEVVALKIKTADWLTWPKSEQRIIEDVFAQACADAFRQHPDDYLADGWFNALCILSIDTSALRSQLEASANGFSTLQLAHLICQGLPFATDPAERGYWMEVPEGTLGAVRSWLLSQETRMLLLRFRLTVRPDDVWLIEEALATQERLALDRLH
jgi:hypothetical protein